MITCTSACLFLLQQRFGSFRKKENVCNQTPCFSLYRKTSLENAFIGSTIPDGLQLRFMGTCSVFERVASKYIGKVINWSSSLLLCTIPRVIYTVHWWEILLRWSTQRLYNVVTYDHYSYIVVHILIQCIATTHTLPHKGNLHCIASACGLCALHRIGAHTCVCSFMHGPWYYRLTFCFACSSFWWPFKVKVNW